MFLFVRSNENPVSSERTGAQLRVYLLLVMVVCGCNSQSQLPLAPVTGEVLLDGKPLRSGAVITTPKQGRGAQGNIDANGRFSLTTRGLGDGAVTGFHQVAVVAYEDSQSSAVSPEAALKLAIPSRYAQPASSGLTMDVRPNEINEVSLTLTSSEE